MPVPVTALGAARGVLDAARGDYQDWPGKRYGGNGPAASREEDFLRPAGVEPAGLCVGGHAASPPACTVWPSSHFSMALRRYLMRPALPGVVLM